MLSELVDKKSIGDRTAGRQIENCIFAAAAFQDSKLQHIVHNPKVTNVACPYAVEDAKRRIAKAEVGCLPK